MAHLKAQQAKNNLTCDVCDLTIAIHKGEKVMNGTGPNYVKKSSMGPVPTIRKSHLWDRSQS